MDVVANSTDSTGTSTGEAVTRIAAAAGVQTIDSTSSAPTIWIDIATVSPSTSMNTGESSRTGTPRAAAASGSVLAKVSGRHMTTSATSTSTAGPDQVAELHGVDRDDLAEQRAELVGRPALVQAEEQHAEAEPERHEHADDRVALAGPHAEQPDDDGGDQRADDRAEHDADAGRAARPPRRRRTAR